jgi:HEAT repeat protein
MMNKPHYSSRRLALLAALVALVSSFAQAVENSGPKEAELIKVLRTAPPAEKAIACKQLAIYGTKEAVPALAPLLADEQLASWARIALEAIPDPAAGEALRNATQKLEGKLLVGVLNSIGVRRDAGAVEQLTGRVKDKDVQVASAAAVALGRIGNPAATKTLRQSLTSAPAPVRTAIAEGCVLCAERLMTEGKANEAAEIYDEVRKADVPKQRKLEATRGSMLARKSEGVPLLVEQLKSTDKAFFRLGLTTARELPGREVAEALSAELARTAPERAALLIYALADRPGFTVSPAILEAAKTGDKQVRVAAIEVIGRSGDAASIATLLASAADADAELVQAAKAALAALPGKNVDAEIAARLAKAEGKDLPVLIEVVGQRRVEATPALVKALEHREAAVRHAALTALGETVGPKELSVLIDQVVEPKNVDDAQIAARALKAASVRMPDREACAAELTAAMSQAPASAKRALLEILGAMGGPKALETIAAAMKGSDEQLQDAGSRVLGEWMKVDAAPVLLDLSKTASSDKYRIRALRGYIRLARQFATSDAQRAEMCQRALDAARRPDEQKLVLTVLEGYPSVEGLKVAVKAAKTPALRDEATRVALVIAQNVSDKGTEARELLAQIGLDPVKVEIIKAEYGAGATQKDVTEALRKQVRDMPLIALPSPSYNESFGGDPMPGTAKQLKVKYKLDGKVGEASFQENAVIMLPAAK